MLVDVVLVVMLEFVPVSVRVVSLWAPWGATAGWVMSILSGEVPAVGLAPLASVVVEVVLVVVLVLWLESADHGLVELGAVAALSVGAMLEEDGEGE